jgi:hypothetical protein
MLWRTLCTFRAPLRSSTLMPLPHDDAGGLRIQMAFSFVCQTTYACTHKINVYIIKPKSIPISVRLLVPHNEYTFSTKYKSACRHDVPWPATGSCRGPVAARIPRERSPGHACAGQTSGGPCSMYAAAWDMDARIHKKWRSEDLLISSGRCMIIREDKGPCKSLMTLPNMNLKKPVKLRYVSADFLRTIQNPVACVYSVWW